MKVLLLHFSFQFKLIKILLGKLGLLGIGQFSLSDPETLQPDLSLSLSVSSSHPLYSLRGFS